jgi:hypothetical protein
MFRSWQVDAYRGWRKELQEIELRNYSEPLDHTRAAVIRACMRGIEIELAIEARVDG